MIRLAKVSDLEEIMRVYEAAKKYMRESGNPLQWKNGYPKRELIAGDIEHETAYVYEEEGRIHGILILQFGEDPTYAKIDGAWRNDAPYAAIHRIGSDGEVKGVFESFVNFAKSKCDNIRIDTHECNSTMRYLLTKHGFEYCGIVTMQDLTLRRAYHFVK